MIFGKAVRVGFSKSHSDLDVCFRFVVYLFWAIPWVFGYRNGVLWEEGLSVWQGHSQYILGSLRGGFPLEDLEIVNTACRWFASCAWVPIHALLD